ncbi:MAG: helix-hairpin-helix domain-containing protein, partial [Lachnospiraceae bacterium]|nr:helix-hairpin-helix domain-containing protein [Lachnospiraceae bacterium]
IMCLYMLSACSSKSYLQKSQEQTAAEKSNGNNSTEGSQSEKNKSTEDEASKGDKSDDCYIQITGAVNKPGVYQCAMGTRLFQLVDMAGGFRVDSYTDNLNLASEVYDGDKILIYTLDDANYILFTGGKLNSFDSGGDSGSALGGSGSGGSGSSGSSSSRGLGGSSGSSGSDSSAGNGGQVNINTASLEELTTLTGIGETRARAIIEYRQQAGGFSSKEELKNVSGIGETTYGKLSDQICVN